MQKHLPKNAVTPEAAQVQRKTQDTSPMEVLQRMPDLEEEDLLQGKFVGAFGNPSQRDLMSGVRGSSTPSRREQFFSPIRNFFNR